MTDQDQAIAARRRRNRRVINRIADPDNGFPILRTLIAKFAPILIQFLMTQLPIWLADVEDIDDTKHLS